MACIICFLDDDFQNKLRSVSQHKGERFEDTLREYRDNFFAEFSYLTSIRKCPHHNKLDYQTIVWATRLHQTIIRIRDKEKFFNSIIDSYIKWISGNIVGAINSLRKTMSTNNLFTLSKNFNSSIYFRGRKSQSILQKEDMYHIPFNKRYLISNQRYSLTGQPILYFGLSVLDILAELRTPINSFDDIFFSSFIISNNNFRIFDFTSPYQAEIKNIEILIKSGSKICYKNQQSKNVSDHTREFYKYMLLNIASFKRGIEDSNFIEEYVIPQMVTEIVRKKKYHGILFTSTRIDNKLAYSEEIFHVNRYKENLALFTNYQKNKNYDNNLINQFLISKPIKLNDCHDIDFSDIEKLSKQIIALNNQKRVFNSLNQLAELSGVSYKTLFEKLKIIDNGTTINYFDHDIGKTHNYILYTQLLTIRNRLL